MRIGFRWPVYIKRETRFIHGDMPLTPFRTGIPAITIRGTAVDKPFDTINWPVTESPKRMTSEGWVDISEVDNQEQ